MVGTSAAIMLFDLVGVVVLLVLAAQVSLWLCEKDSTPMHIPDPNTNIHLPRHSCSHYHPAPHSSYQP